MISDDLFITASLKDENCNQNKLTRLKVSSKNPI
jgi:hypothetical protein